MDAHAHLHPVPAAWLQDSDLAQFASAYVRRLIDRRYAQRTRLGYLNCVAHFACWMKAQRLSSGELTDLVVRRFLDEHLPRCRCSARVQRSYHQLRAALHQLLALLDELGIAKRPQDSDPIDVELDRFDRYMRHARGLAQNTRAQRLRILKTFLRTRRGGSIPLRSAVTAHALRRFIEQQLRRWSPASAHVLSGALRSYLRFRAQCGDSVTHLLPAIATPANWRHTTLPQTLSPGELDRLLAAFPMQLASVGRDYAMVRCVVDIGLRAHEVVGLELEDIDWRAGTIRIGQNKARRVDVLPLPHDTGKAIAAYLRNERPGSANRRVFVRHVAPMDEPVGPGVVRRAVREAYRRCGLPHTRVHLLRHTLANRVLAGGGTLEEVADVLRHRQLDTTLIYAKLDIERLAAVAMPWPGSRS